MPKRGAAKESNGAPAPANAHDERVAGLRKEMAKHNVQAYIVPSEDPHMVGQLLVPPGVVCIKKTLEDKTYLQSYIYTENAQMSRGVNCLSFAERVRTFNHGAAPLHQPFHRLSWHCRGHE